MAEKNIPVIGDFNEIFSKSEEGKFYKDIIEYIEKPLIEWALSRTYGNQIKAAKLLGINRNTIRTKIKRLAIIPKRYK